MKNYTKQTLSNESRIELKKLLGLTGAEVSINKIPTGGCVPFIHAHRNNEEIYGILSGNGKIVVDGEDVLLNQGDWIKVSPAVNRQIFAGNSADITYICIQVKENSLDTYTMTDAIIIK